MNSNSNSAVIGSSFNSDLMEKRQILQGDIRSLNRAEDPELIAMYRAEAEAREAAHLANAQAQRRAETRVSALHLAAAGRDPSENPADTVARAEAYFAFLTA